MDLFSLLVDMDSEPKHKVKGSYLENEFNEVVNAL